MRLRAIQTGFISANGQLVKAGEEFDYEGAVPSWAVPVAALGPPPDEPSPQDGDTDKQDDGEEAPPPPAASRGRQKSSNPS